jgi:nicotinamidase-related amidase
VIHVQHVSRERTSPLHPSTFGHEFLAFARPRPDETVIQKTGGSAFHDTTLARDLRDGDHDSIVVAGFTLNHCVDASVRAAADLGFTVYLAADATVSFGRVGPSGHAIAPDVLHDSSLACLSQEFAVVVDTGDLLLDASAGVAELVP